MRRGLIALSLALAACSTMQPVAAPAAPRGADAGSGLPAALPRDASASLDPSQAPAGEYHLDSRHASVIWRVRHMGLSIFTARFDGCPAPSGSPCSQPGVSATINFNPTAPTQSSLNVTIETSSVDTGLVNPQGQRSFDHSIAEVLGGGQITFVSHAITQTSPSTGVITGDLTLHGQTHPATIEVTFQGGRAVALRGGKYVLAFSGRSVIQRSQWGAGSVIFDQFAADAVEILIEGEFVQG